jgi:hypothetical protein
MTEMIDNVFENFLYTTGESIGNNVVGAVTWKLLNSIEEATGGTHLPAVSVLGNMVDLSTFTIEGIAKTAMFGISALTNIGNIVTSIGSGGGLELGAWGGAEYTHRGGDFTSTVGGVQSTKSGSRTITSGASSDTKKAAIASTEEDQEAQKKLSKESTKDEITIETFYKEVFDRRTVINVVDNPVKKEVTQVVATATDIASKTSQIYNLIDKCVASGRSAFNVKIVNYDDMPLPRFPSSIDIKTISDIDSKAVDKLADAISTGSSDNNSGFTIDELKDALEDVTIRVEDYDVYNELVEINSNLY